MRIEMTAPGEDFRAPSSFECARGFWVTHGGRRITISVDDEALGAGAGGAADEALQPADRGELRRLGPAVRAVPRAAASRRAGRGRGGALSVSTGRGGAGQRRDAETGRPRPALLFPARHPDPVAGAADI